jgi:hypothetical protein
MVDAPGEGIDTVHQKKKKIQAVHNCSNTPQLMAENRREGCSDKNVLSFESLV